MATLEQIEILMSGLGPVLDPLAIDASVEPRCWGIAMAEDLVVLVQFDERKNCLVLSCELGSPPAGDRTKLYETLLQMNYHWETTGGNRMAIDGPAGNVVQLFEMGVHDIDVSRLSRVISTFAGTAKAWRDYISRDSSSQSLPPAMSGNAGIKV